MSSKTSLLWKLTRPESDLTSFLFGTMHIRDRRAFSGLDVVYACIDECEAFALEIDLNEQAGFTDPGLMELPGFSTLRDHLTPHALARLRKILLKAYGIDIALLSRYSPLALTDIITARVLSEDHPLFLDAHLWEYAEGVGKTTIGIETLVEQSSLLERIPMDLQVKMLRQVGKNTRSFRALLSRMAEVYQSGDLKNLHRLSRRSAGTLRKWMLFDRNEIMAWRMAEILPRQSVFCAIGAGHLWGGKGVLRRLKQRGFRADPVHLP